MYFCRRSFESQNCLNFPPFHAGCNPGLVSDPVEVHRDGGKDVWVSLGASHGSPKGGGADQLCRGVEQGASRVTLAEIELIKGT